jgi:hypothetical protein
MASSSRRKSSPRRQNQRVHQETDDVTVTETPALELVQALARHQAWLDLLADDNSSFGNLINRSLLTPSD